MKQAEHSLAEALPHRFQQAEQSLESARLLMTTDMAGAVHRLYYSLFYALTALALFCRYETSKHQQLIGCFNKEWINTGKIDKRYGKVAKELFEKRQESDYEVFVTHEPDEIAAMIPSVEDFIARMKAIVNKTSPGSEAAV